jgi:hypothetical protein
VCEAYLFFFPQQLLDLLEGCPRRLSHWIPLVERYGDSDLLWIMMKVDEKAVLVAHSSVDEMTTAANAQA